MSRERDEDFRERERDDDAGAPAAEERKETEHKAFIGGLSFALDDLRLRDAFREFDATDAKIMMDRATGRSRGFGFVWFRDKRGLDEAIERMHNSDLDGRRISVARAVPQSETAPGTPADLLRKGQSFPRESGRYDRGPRGGGYGGGYRDDRYAAPRDYGYRPSYDYRSGGYGGGYDRGAYGGGYDRGGYGGYDRGSYGGYGDYRGAEQYGGGYGGYGGYDQGGYDRRAYEASYDDRYRSGGGGGGGYGADRGHDRGGRAGPYDRPPAR